MWKPIDTIPLKQGTDFLVRNTTEYGGPYHNLVYFVIEDSRELGGAWYDQHEEVSLSMYDEWTEVPK